MYNMPGYDRCAVFASVKIYIAGYYAQCAFVSVPGRNNMSGYDQGSHLASLAQTQLLLAKASLCRCLVCKRSTFVCTQGNVLGGFSNVHYPVKNSKCGEKFIMGYVRCT